SGRTLAADTAIARDALATLDPSRVVVTLADGFLEYFTADGKAERHQAAAATTLPPIVTRKPDELLRLAWKGIDLELTLASLTGDVRRTVDLPSRYSWKTAAAIA